MEPNVSDPKVDAYIGRSKLWPDEMSALRPILLGCGLTESIKWGKPCFSHAGGNIAIMQEMKAFLALMFFKGALLEDPLGVLKEQGPNSRSARRMEFTSVDQVRELADPIRDYVEEAVDVEQVGLEVGPAPEVVFCDELLARLDTDDAFRAAFDSLTPGRQREYNLFISDAKQAKTRDARVAKYAPRILEGRACGTDATRHHTRDASRPTGASDVVRE